MTLSELLLIAVGLSMDAFAVAMSKGLSTPKLRLPHTAVVGLYFGVFQGLMPLIGYYLGVNFREYIESFDHWIAFVLLSVIGVKMIYEVIKGEDENLDASFSPSAMLPLAVATSIDALAAGVSFACLNIRILPAVLSIGAITFVLSAVGVYLGHIFGAKYKSRAEIAGGVILIGMGIKILIEHLTA